MTKISQKEEEELNEFIKKLFPSEKEQNEVLKELKSDDVKIKSIEDMKFVDWKSMVGNLTTKQRGIIGKRIQEISSEERRKTEVNMLTGNVIKMQTFKPKEYTYSMDFRYWSVEDAQKFMMNNGLPKTAKYDVKDFDGLKLINFEKNKMGMLQSFRMKQSVLDKIFELKALAKKEYSATVLTRAARQVSHNRLNKLYALRTRIAQELLSTEENYVLQLDTLVKVIVDPIEKMKGDKELLSIEQQKKIFGDIKIILSVNQQFLAEFKKIIGHWNSDSKIGILFATISKFLLVYTGYCQNYPMAEKEIKNLGDDHPFMKFYYDEITKKAPKEYQQYDIRSFLITPVQRIPRYKLLLEDLKKHTPEKHCDYENLVNGLKTISEVAIKVNDYAKQFEHLERVNELEEKIDFPPKSERINLIEPGRIYVKDTIVMALISKKVFVYHCILFTDILLFCKYKAKIGKTMDKRCMCKDRYETFNTEVDEVQPDELTKHKELIPETTIKIADKVSSRHMALICFQNKRERDDWEKTLKETFKNEFEKRKKVTDIRKNKNKIQQDDMKKADLISSQLKYSQTKGGQRESVSWKDRGKSLYQMSPSEQRKTINEHSQPSNEEIKQKSKENLKESKTPKSETKQHKHSESKQSSKQHKPAASKENLKESSKTPRDKK